MKTLGVVTFLSILMQAEYLFAQTITAEQREFFQQKILPVLRSRCYSCHSSSSGLRRGGLALDSRSGVFAGGSAGPAVNTNEPASSILIKSLQGQDGYKLMPPRAALADSAIGDFETWIRMGAPYPRVFEILPRSIESLARERDRSLSGRPIPVSNTRRADGDRRIREQSRGKKTGGTGRFDLGADQHSGVPVRGGTHTRTTSPPCA